MGVIRGPGHYLKKTWKSQKTHIMYLQAEVSLCPLKLQSSCIISLIFLYSTRTIMKLCLVVSTILAVLNGSVAARLGLRSAEEPEWCKNGMDPENYSLVNSVCEECADVFRNHPGVYGLCK